ncbi:hypothetical protein GCM10022251_35440 [Phytohabitans flavus]|uniref:DUF1345 domain-containing protein n=1 Tax=Phytohabitans flavus TaxID=1076124 RepID=A0A6F8XMT6_9ACTN|nr:hypothetical protein [Phytohabitans flavus]BCB75091.1 hypothetical protein Pflav_015010 [Phytohabitans flavus]
MRARWLSHWIHARDRRWPAALVIVVLIILQWLTPDRLNFEPPWLLPGLELLLLAILVALHRYEVRRKAQLVRTLFTAVFAMASLAMVWSVGRLITLLVIAGDPDSPKTVILTGGVIWVNAIGIFGLWYWQMDGGGPAARAEGRRPYPDFLFPQTAVQGAAPTGWRPNLIDYLYLSFTNSTAYSPTHTLPISALAKLSMALQGALSLLIIVVVVARAIGIK